MRVSDVIWFSISFRISRSRKNIAEIFLFCQFARSPNIYIVSYSLWQEEWQRNYMSVGGWNDKAMWANFYASPAWRTQRTGNKDHLLFSAMMPYEKRKKKIIYLRGFEIERWSVLLSFLLWYFFPNHKLFKPLTSFWEVFAEKIHKSGK